MSITMRRGSSFKAQYRLAPPARPQTPPRPQWEPLSPVLPPADLISPSHPAAHASNAASRSARLANGGAAYPSAGVGRGRAPRQHPEPPAPAGHEPPLRSAPLPRPHPAHAASSLASPIEALADASGPLHAPNPALLDPSRRASYAAATSPAQYASDYHHHHHHHHQHHHDAFARDTSYGHNDRPTKRARSEHHTSPHYGQHQSRPATSHIPGWSYNVEQMMDSGMRMYQDTRPFAPQPNEGGDKMLSDAELLLFFSNVSAHTAQSPPSTAKRWSISQPPPAELPPQQLQPPHEPLSPYAPTAHMSSHQQHQPQLTLADVKPVLDAPSHPSDVAVADAAPTSQTQTPPEESITTIPQPPPQEGASVADTKPKKHQGWPKGKARGPRSTPSTSKRKRSTPKPKSASSASTSTVPDQLQSPQSLPAERPAAMVANGVDPVQPRAEQLQTSSRNRRHSFSTLLAPTITNDPQSTALRSRSVPLGVEQVITAPVGELRRPNKKAVVEAPELICAACNSNESEVKVGDGEQWIGCDGCKQWYHYACAGFSSEREVRDVNKFYCDPCRPKFGETTKVRKSVRAHTTVDYAGLNEGVLKTSDDNPEHHYIAAFKNGDIEFTPETFARMPPELISADYLEKTNGFKEPILIPGSLNPRAYVSEDDSQTAYPSVEEDDDSPGAHFEYEGVTDDGQDKLDMVIPKGLTVRRVAELYGQNEPVPVIDVKAQEGEVKKWTMGKWADYYEQQGEKPVRNVISLEVSRSRLGRLIRRPKAVRDMDLQDSVWREDDKLAPPPVQFYCLMSVADCFTDFHIDFGGSSVYYHIVKGRKVFFFIPPTKQNLKKYEDWCLSPNQGHDWLGKQVKECYRVDLYPGDTMLIPSGWIHAVWTPEDSLVIGGNFLTRVHYGMQIRVLEIEKSTKVAAQFRYPFFQKIMWLTVIKYLEDDPVPESVQQLLQSGEQFHRSTPIYCEPQRFGHNSHLGPPNYNRRYYSKHELEGVTELLAYIWRTVLITLGKLDLPQKTRAAVTKSIPKGHGEPLVLAKRFAMWIAWKRGNETVPTWALPDASLPELPEGGEKKLSAAQVKKMERESLNEVLRATAERSSARIRASDASPPQIPPTPPSPTSMEAMLQLDGGPVTAGPLTGFLRPSANNPHITTPKTSQLGPKRVACDACRKRRIRCKHKDELIDTSKPGMHTIDLSGSYGISVKRRLSDHSIADGQTSTASGPVNGGPIMADVNGDPYALKSGRVKACADCRKSKRRCIHDEYGNVDPIKANEVPIPRGSATKKRRISDDDSTGSKRMKQESSYDEDYMNGDMHSRHSLPAHFGVGSSLLQDIAFSAQQALDQRDDDLVPVDPALQAYATGAFSAMDMTPSYGNGDTIMSSIEHHSNSTTLMDGIEFTENGTTTGPSVEPLTPGPPPHNDTIHVQTNGVKSTPNHQDLIRHPSPPVSPTIISDNKKASTEFALQPTTPVTTQHHHRRSSTTKSATTKTPNRSNQAKTPKSTPSSKRTDVKIEGMDTSNINGSAADSALSELAGMGMGVGMGVDLNDLDEASRELIKQLQQEERGLRRRSR